MPVPTVVLADDHPMFRDALRLSVHQLYPKATIAEVDSLPKLKELVSGSPKVDLILLDLEMPGADGFSSLMHLRRTHPAIRVAIVSGVEKRLCMQSAQALGAVAFLPKSLGPPQMQAAIAKVLGGESWWPTSMQEPETVDLTQDPEIQRKAERLTQQELRVLLCLGDGRMNKQIAGDLGISEGTVKVHMKSILRKLEFHHRTEAALFARHLVSIVPPSRVLLDADARG